MKPLNIEAVKEVFESMKVLLDENNNPLSLADLARCPDCSEGFICPVCWLTRRICWSIEEGRRGS